MKYAKIKFNDVANAPGISVSVYLQGCPHRCKNCFNPETWDFNGGYDFTEDTMKEILKGINAHGIKRSLCILGGEPLCLENRILTLKIIKEVLHYYSDTKVYIWTGYLYKQLLDEKDPVLTEIFKLSYCLVDGPFIDELKDLNLQMRGSKNQNIIYLT